MPLYINNKNNNSIKTSLNNSKNKSGGKAIASGGYGCVLRPSLMCQGDTTRQTGMISKLMKKKHAINEMKEVNGAKRVLRKIPNYEKYFAVTNYKICVPAPLTRTDLKNFNDECHSPLNSDSTKINKNIDNYRAINSPDLGRDVSKSFIKLFDNPSVSMLKYNDILEQLYNFNETSMDFLKNGISKMAEVGYYHSDVKPQNILTNYNENPKKGTNQTGSFTQMKLIDFGLALPVNAKYVDVNRHTLFNFPVSSFMFSRRIIEKLDNIIKDAIKGDINSKITHEIQGMVDNIFMGHEFNHIDYMIELGEIIYKKNSDEYENQLKQFFIDYCSEIVKNFIKKSSTGDYSFDANGYWEEVYRYNLDVWGFLTSFLVLASEASTHYPRITDMYKNIVDGFLYNTNYAIEKIPVDDLIVALQAINSKIKRTINFLKPKPQIPQIPKTPTSPSHINAHTNNPIKIVSLNKPKRLTIKKRKLIVKKKSQKSNKDHVDVRPIRSVISLHGKKCPKGYIRHKTEKSKCVKRKINKTINRSINSSHIGTFRAVVRDSIKPGISLKGKRCPKGYRRHKNIANRCIEMKK